MKIVVLVPTKSEAQFIDRDDFKVVFTGVGITSSAYATAKTIINEQPDVVIMAGIAGVYKGSKYKIGDCVLVSKEHEADLGFFYPDGFKHISDMSLDMDFPIIKSYETPYTDPKLPLPFATANTMNAAMAPFVKIEGIDVESMEGSAFFHVCLEEGVEFYEIRSVSNVVDVNRDDWDYPTSIKNMTKGLYELIDYLKLR